MRSIVKNLLYIIFVCKQSFLFCCSKAFSQISSKRIEFCTTKKYKLLPHHKVSPDTFLNSPVNDDTMQERARVNLSLKLFKCNPVCFLYRPGFCDIGYQWQLCSGSHGFGQVPAQPQHVQEAGGTHWSASVRALPVRNFTHASGISTFLNHSGSTPVMSCLVFQLDG